MHSLLASSTTRPHTQRPCRAPVPRLVHLRRPAHLPRACRTPRLRAVGPERSSARCSGLVGRVAALCRDPVSRHNPAGHCPCYHNPVNCIAIQYQPSSLQYKPVYFNTLPAHPSHCIAIQLNPISLCCNTLSCNTMPSLLKPFHFAIH